MDTDQEAMDRLCKVVRVPRGQPWFNVMLALSNFVNGTGDQTFARTVRALVEYHQSTWN